MYLQAIATAYVAGIPLESIIHSIEEVRVFQGRFEAVNAGQDFSVIVDYAHTPDSLENVLKTVQQFAKKRFLLLLAVVEIGIKQNDPLMAKIACELATDPSFHF